MKKILYIMFLLSLGLFLACKQEMVPLYDLEDEAINFAKKASNPSNTYPNVLYESININSVDYQAMDQVPVQLNVKTQGHVKNIERKYTFQSDSIVKGTGVNTYSPVYSILPDASSSTAAIFIKRDGRLPLGKSTIIAVAFDYSKSDFIRGLDERQYYRIEVFNYYLPENVGLLNLAEWNSLFRGFKNTSTGLGNPSGFGPWSSQKALFIVEVLGITNFKTALPRVTKAGVAATAEFVAAREKLREALALYRKNNASDPVKYPALIDEIKGGSNWIAFVEE